MSCRYFVSNLNDSFQTNHRGERLAGLVSEPPVKDATRPPETAIQGSTHVERKGDLGPKFERATGHKLTITFAAQTAHDAIWNRRRDFMKSTAASGLAPRPVEPVAARRDLPAPTNQRDESMPGGAPQGGASTPRDPRSARRSASGGSTAVGWPACAASCSRVGRLVTSSAGWYRASSSGRGLSRKGSVVHLHRVVLLSTSIRQGNRRTRSGRPLYPQAPVIGPP